MPPATPPEIVESESPIIAVDLDGTLVATDTLWESVIVYVLRRPWNLFQLLSWLLQGRAEFKHHVALAAPIDVTVLPYRADLLEWLTEQRLRGRKLILATGADGILARGVAAHLGIFDSVISSDGSRNVTGAVKARMIADAAEGQRFDYAGNDHADLAVWREAQRCIVVAPRGFHRRLAGKGVQTSVEFAVRQGGAVTWLRELRVFQWVKNLLIFLPLASSHRLADWKTLRPALLGFLAFSMISSAGYLVNDLMDLEADRKHSAKRSRPLAAGLISIPAALLAAVILVIASTAVCRLLLPPVSCWIVLGYFAASVLYSVYMKRLLIADVLILSLFYTLRVLFGGAVGNIEVSVWTLAFSMFSFFALASIKRIAEIARREPDSNAQIKGRAYRSASDRFPLIAQAAASANAAVLVLILYLNSADVLLLYRRPKVLWGVCPLILYWFSRALMLANQGEVSEDPVLFALRDRVSLGLLVAFVIIVLLAT